MTAPRTTPSDIPLNPDFGNGIFRRRIRLQGLSLPDKRGKVIAELEDCNHGFRSTVFHDSKQVTAIEAEALRIPLSTCAGALNPIQALVGTKLNADTLSISRQVNPRANCTHLYDLTVLAIHHCQRGETLRQFDVSIPDEKDGPTEVTVTLNGEPLLNWTIANWFVVSEGKAKGRSLGKGFSKWASELYSGDEQEAVFILQKGYFVSGARRFDIQQLEGLSVTELSDMAGVCYSYTPGVVEGAVRTTGNIRDFTHTPEQLLTFQ